jgi:hypothetical protein
MGGKRNVSQPSVLNAGPLGAYAIAETVCLGRNSRRRVRRGRTGKGNGEKRQLNKAQRLQAGETFVSREPGNSMTPIIKSRQPVKLSPCKWEDCKKGDIVYCKVNGRYYTHLVKAKSKGRGVLIGNNHGRNNGWTRKVYGKVVEILPMEG